MRRCVLVLVGGGLAASTAAAANLNITARANGSSSITVPSGTVVNYELIGELSDDQNEGLALWGADLTLTCNGAIVPLSQGNTPVTPPMDNFVSSPTNTKGLSNPAGYPGTPKDGKLLQAGGAQNTIKNTAANAPFPTGTPILGVAWPGSPVTLLTGSFTAENSTENDILCTLSVTNVFANQIRDGELLENVFLKTEAAGVGNITNLNVTVTVPDGDVTLLSSAPACNGSLWRSANNFALLTFDGSPSNPGAGQVRVREIVAGGGYGEDVTGQFTFAVDGDVLRVTQTGPVGPAGTNDGQVEHRKWYTIEPDGWAGVSPFKVDFVVQVGDANGDGRVNSFDVSSINGNVPFPCINTTTCAGLRNDVNGDNRVNSFDVSTVNGRLTSLLVAKPGGHVCNP